MRLVVVAAALLTAGCTKQPDIFAPPVQRQPQLVSPSDGLGPFAAMGAPGVERYILSGAWPTPDSNLWRYLEQDAQFRFRVPVTRQLRLRAQMYLIGYVVQATGPVEATFYVNGKELGKIKGDKAEEIFFDQPVPESWLNTQEPILVRIHADKALTPSDGSRSQTFALKGIGFVQ